MSRARDAWRFRSERVNPHSASNGARRQRAGLVGWLLSAEPVSDATIERSRHLRVRLAAGLCVAATLAIVASCLAGCGNASEASASESTPGEPQPVSYTVVNLSDLPVRDVMLYGEGLGRRLGYGQVRTGGRETLTASDGLYVPMKVNLDWTDAGGERHYKKLDIWKALGAGYRGPVTLTIDSRGQVQIDR